MNYTTDSDGKKKTFNEINITPLTDIFLVLLIIMMVIAPSFQDADNKIQMPEINSGLAIEQKDATVSITKEGQIFINGAYTTEDALENKLASIIATLDKKEVVVRADKSTKSAEILKVMRAAQESGYEKMTVAGEPLSKKQQKELQNNINEENIVE